jgi:superfamily II DNA or RNA helicase
MPAFQYDPYHYRLHRARGGSFKDYKDKQFKPLTDVEVEKHLTGEQLIGIYPLLNDNTSHFIAADFDGNHWKEESTTFLSVCYSKNIPAYLERSRSGNGAHVWIFFVRSYPAFRSRKIATGLLEQAGVFSAFDKDPSFDRLFPSQDYLSGKGLGNLIALPLHGKSFKEGNSCFIDAKTFVPQKDQWEFIKDIQKISVECLDREFQSIGKKDVRSTPLFEAEVSDTLIIKLDKKVIMNRSGMSMVLINYLKEELNFTNNEFLIKKKLGKNTWGIERYFKLVEEQENIVLIPRGFAGNLLRFCDKHKLNYQFIDERKKLKPVQFNSKILLKEHQQKVVDACARKDFGVIVAPPGSGKTIMGLSLIAEKKQHTLIIVHRKQLADQWIDRIESFLGIPRRDIGVIGSGKSKIKGPITVAMIQSLGKKLLSSEGPEIQKAFGTIFIDECHHVPAETYRNTISKLHSYFLYGLTATPFRKYNDGKLIFTHLGEVIAEIKQSEIADQPRARIIVRNTNLAIPFDSRTDNMETLSKVLVHDSARNKLILADVSKELRSGKKVVLITERKEHIETLNQYLKQSYETLTLSGADSESSRKTKWGLLRKGDFQILITTGQYFGEGSDLSNISCVFLAYPFSFEGKLVQYIGRVQRSEIAPSIYDYRDQKVPYLEKLFQKRNLYYRKLYGEGTLFDSPTSEDDGVRTINASIKVAFEDLQFRYGTVGFKYRSKELQEELEFEIENLSIRPEFKVLSPYFVKILRSKFVRVDIVVKLQDSVPTFLAAFSEDIERINKEVIDSVRFRFVKRNLIGRVPTGDVDPNMLNIDQLQNTVGDATALYKNEDELVEELLKLTNAKHYEHIRYLAANHDRSILKIRFVLMPFSFVFLLSGTHQYHIVWETLDTEEATYIWHIDKSIDLLRTKLLQIDKEIGYIREKGRQTFIDALPEDFTRIIHDYSEARKGFILWKDQLEERIA